MTFKNRAGALVGSLAIAAALTACGGAKTDVAPAPAGDAAVVATTAPSDAAAGNPAGAPASDSGAAAAPVGAAGGDVFVVDPITMADQPCHVMNNTIMGQCTEAEIAKVVGETDFLPRNNEAMTDAPCHVMDGAIMGKCGDADVARLRSESAIIVDTAKMTSMGCHQMDGWIMGGCSEADVKRLADEIRAARPAAPAQP